MLANYYWKNQLFIPVRKGKLTEWVIVCKRWSLRICYLSTICNSKLFSNILGILYLFFHWISFIVYEYICKSFHWSAYWYVLFWVSVLKVRNCKEWYLFTMFTGVYPVQLVTMWTPTPPTVTPVLIMRLSGQG